MPKKHDITAPELNRNSVHADPRSRLKKQPLDSSRPWQPGEVPAGPLIVTIRPQGQRDYGQDRMATEPPTKRGTLGRPKITADNVRFPRKG